MTPQEKVREFHAVFGGLGPRYPQHPLPSIALLRARLVNEEAKEFEQAIKAGDIVNAAKELADLLYVVYGAADAYGIELDTVFDLVHESNMSKLGADGKPVVREDGKVLKGPNFKPAEPEVAGELVRQTQVVAGLPEGGADEVLRILTRRPA